MSINKLPASIPRDSLELELLLDWNANDTSWNWNDWTASNVTWVDDNIGYQKIAWDFEKSSSSKVDIPADTWDLSLTGNFTFAWWFNSESLPVNAYNPSIINNDASWNRWMGLSTANWASNLGSVNFVAHSTTASQHFVSYNFTSSFIWEWHFAAATYDWTDIKLYVDWTLEDTENVWSRTWSDNNVQFDIWRNQYDTHNNRYFDWRLAMVRVYSRDIWQEWVTNLYKEWLRKLAQDRGNNPALLSDLVKYWDFKWDWNDIITWTVWTVTWATLATDSLWQSNSAYNFNATTEEIDTWEQMTDNTDGTIIARVRITTWTASWWVISDRWASGEYLQIYLTAWTPWFLYRLNEAAERNVTWWTISLDTWYTIALTWDSSNFRAYRDWVADWTADSMTWPWYTSANNLHFWQSPNSNASADFDIDYCMAFDRALSSDELVAIQTLMDVKYIYPFNKTLPWNLLTDMEKWIRTSDWVDLSWNWNDLTPANVTAWRILTHVIWTFNGTSSNIINSTATTIWIANAWTISCWVNPDTISWSDNILALENPWVTANDAIFFRLESGQIRLQNYSSTWSVIKLYVWGSTLSTWVWQHIIVTWDWTDLKFFLDWVEESYTKTTDNSWTMWTQTRKIQIWSSNWAGFFDWKLWDIIVSSRTWTATEVQQHYFSTYHQQK